MKRAILFAACTLFVAVSMSGQEGMPPGKWWRRAEIVRNLSLTEDQQNRLEVIFRNASTELIDTRAENEKAMIALRGELDRPQLDRAAIRKAAQRVNDARARRFERELMMLVDMRAVLNDEQWNRMRAALDRLQDGPKDNRRPKQGGQPRPQPHEE
jgi:Spy/CpxP family protein refolding chaperone